MRNRSLPLEVYALPLVTAFMLPNLVTPLMELLRAEIGFSSGMLTVVFVAYLGGLAPAFLLAPSLAAMWGRRRVQSAACVLGIASCGAYLIADNVAVLLVARVLTGLCSGLILVLGPSAVQSVAGRTERRKATFVATMGIAIGLAGGPLFSGLVAGFLPWPTKLVFALMAALFVIALPVIGTEQETPRQDVRSWLPFHGLDGRATRTVITGLGAFGPGMTAAAIILALSPTLLSGLGGPVGPFVAGLMAGGMYVVSPIAQACVRRMGTMTHIRVALVLIAVAMAVFCTAVYTRSVAVLIVAACLMGAGQGISNLGSFGLIHENLASDKIPGATALLSLGVYASASVVPLAGGFLLDAKGLEASGAYMAIGVVVMVIVGAVFARKGFIEKTEGVASCG